MEILTVFHTRGGAGTSTMVMNLGATLSRRGKRILVVDGNRNCGLSLNLGFRKPTAPVVEPWVPQPTRVPGLELVRPSSEQLDLFDSVTPARLQDQLDTFHGYDACIIDVPSYCLGIGEAALAVANTVLIPSYPDARVDWAVSSTLKQIDQARQQCPGAATRIIGVTTRFESGRYEIQFHATACQQWAFWLPTPIRDHHRVNQEAWTHSLPAVSVGGPRSRAFVDHLTLAQALGYA